MNSEEAIDHLWRENPLALQYIVSLAIMVSVGIVYGEFTGVLVAIGFTIVSSPFVKSRRRANQGDDGV